MSDAKHTPGPWEWDGSNSVSAGDVAIANLEGDPEFWGTGYTAPGFLQAEANGLLIAAAPDLLAACELFMELDNHVGADHDLKSWARLMEIIKAAIQKDTEGVS